MSIKEHRVLVNHEVLEKNVTNKIVGTCMETGTTIRLKNSDVVRPWKKKKYKKTQIKMEAGSGRRF